MRIPLSGHVCHPQTRLSHTLSLLFLSIRYKIYRNRVNDALLHRDFQQRGDAFPEGGVEQTERLEEASKHGWVGEIERLCKGGGFDGEERDEAVVAAVKENRLVRPQSCEQVKPERPCHDDAPPTPGKNHQLSLRPPSCSEAGILFQFQVIRCWG